MCFYICVSCFRATKLCWADGLPVVRELTEVIKHFSYSTQQVTYRSLAQLSTKFILLINGKILTFISMTNTTSNRSNSPVENKNDLELDFKVFFFTDSCCSDIVHDESN